MSIWALEQKQIELSDGRVWNTDSQCAVWDMNIPREGKFSTSFEDVVAFLRKYGKKWAFQGEKGQNSGYRHWQIKYSLHTKRCLSPLVDLLQSMKIYPCLKAGNVMISPTSINGKEKFSYVMKEDTPKTVLGLIRTIKILFQSLLLRSPVNGILGRGIILTFCLL